MGKERTAKNRIEVLSWHGGAPETSLEVSQQKLSELLVGIEMRPFMLDHFEPVGKMLESAPLGSMVVRSFYELKCSHPGTASHIEHQSIRIADAHKWQEAAVVAFAKIVALLERGVHRISE